MSVRYTNLGGYSGCKVFLCEDNKNKNYVRKISSNIEYNQRLILQMNKQKNFNSNYLKVPKILKSGITDDGLFYFDMEYIKGVTLSEYIKKIEIGEVRSLVEKLFLELKPNNDIIENNQDIFIKKIKELKIKTDRNYILKKAINLLEKHNWQYFKIESCHGDLTLENIIIKENELYLIDFLDSFYESKLLDISTLFQDTLILWSYRNEELDSNTLIRLILFKDILIDYLKKELKDNWIEIYYALLLKLVRIYPYIKDKETFKFLNKKIKMLMQLIIEQEKKNEKFNYSLCKW